MIPRSGYLGRLAKLREQPKVKLLCGIRGCGKTTLLAMYIDWLKRSGVEDGQIIYINMEDPESESLLHYQGLYSHIKKRLCREKFTYIFIDEIQRCGQYEKAVEGLLLKKQVDVYAAASNACCFSATPYVEIRVLPLSFAEYLVFSKVRGKSPRLPEDANGASSVPAGERSAKTSPSKMERRLPRQREQLEKYLQREAFNNYASFGGFPFVSLMGGDAGLLQQCVSGIYNTVLVRDLARQAGINDIPLLEQTAQIMSGFIGNPLSSKKLSMQINVKGRKISSNTVETYMRSLCSAFVFYHTARFDIKTGRRLKTLGKYYIADMGIRNMLMHPTDAGLDGPLENIVCLELLRRGFVVCTGKYGGDEVSLIAFSSGGDITASNNSGETGGRIYFQIASSVRDPAVLARKLSPLQRIQDNYPKFILSLDQTPFRSVHDGIVQQNVIDWLLEK